MIRELLSLALRAATSLKLTPKKYFVFFGDPEEGGKDGTGPQKDLRRKDFLENFQGSRKNRAASFVGGYLWGPRKDFFAEKDFWEKEEQALKPWCLPSGKYPKRALKMGPPKKICKAKIFWGVLQGSRKNRAASFVGGYLWGPRKDFCEAKRFVGKGAAGVESVAVDFSQLLAQCAPWNFQGPRKEFCEAKRFVGKGGTDVISVAFAFRRMPAKGVVFRRGAADRPRTDTPSGTGS